MANLVKYTYDTDKSLNFTDTIYSFAPFTRYIFADSPKGLVLYVYNQRVVFNVSNNRSIQFQENGNNISLKNCLNDNNFNLSAGALKYGTQPVASLIIISGDPYASTNRPNVLYIPLFNGNRPINLNTQFETPDTITIEVAVAAIYLTSNIYAPIQNLVFKYQSGYTAYFTRDKSWPIPASIPLTQIGDPEINNIFNSDTLLWRENNKYYSINQYAAITNQHPYYDIDHVSMYYPTNQTKTIYEMEQHTSTDFYSYGIQYQPNNAYVNEGGTPKIVPKTRLVKITNSSGTARLLKTD